MVDEMEPLYEEFDVLLTASSTPAARLDELIGSGFAQKWEKPNIYTPSNVTGGPALAVCNGFTENGLPLAMQIAGRPFDEETVLRVGDAYERATTWRSRRPQLTPGVRASELVAPPEEKLAAMDVDSATRTTVEEASKRAGLTLNDEQRALLYRVAPTVLAAVRRVRGDHPWSDEPANAFFFDGEQH